MSWSFHRLHFSTWFLLLLGCFFLQVVKELIKQGFEENMVVYIAILSSFSVCALVIQAIKWVCMSKGLIIDVTFMIQVTVITWNCFSTQRLVVVRHSIRPMQALVVVTSTAALLAISSRKRSP